MEKGEVIEYCWVIKFIENVQKKVEGCNFDICKLLFEYDDVVNDQCRVVYEQCNDILYVEDLFENIKVIWVDVVNDFISGYILFQSMEEQWEVVELEKVLEFDFWVLMFI